MLASSVPVKFQQPFANNAGPSYTRAIPNTTVDTTAASLNLGFPPACFVDVALGGTPPNGMDFNGILNEITANTQWWQAGGFAAYDSVFSTAIGGYPNGAILQMATGKGFWKSTIDNNTSDPDTSGANWSVAAIAPGAYLDLSVAGGVDVTLTSVQSANRVIDLFGTLTANINVIVPTATGDWIFNNGTTGAFTVTVKTAAGTGFTISQGTSVELWSDGVNVYSGVSAALTVAEADARYPIFPYAVQNLKIAAPGLNSYTQTITADYAVLRNSAGLAYMASAINLTVNANGVVGAPLSIMSARAGSTWYYRRLWYNATAGLTIVLDPNLTPVSAPTGYSLTDFTCLLAGASRTDGTANQYLLQIETVDSLSQYVPLTGSNTTSLVSLASGTQGSISVPTWVPIAVSGVVPIATAKSIKTVLSSLGGGIAMVAPNSSYGAYNSSSNFPVCVVLSASGAVDVKESEFLLESSSIFYAGSGCVLACLGWGD